MSQQNSQGKWEIVSSEHSWSNRPAHTFQSGDALTIGTSEQSARNPALAYLLSLPSPLSRRTMASFLGRVVRITSGSSASTLHSFDWAGMRRQHVQAVLALLSSAGLAPSTINTYLAALKGVALEAWALRLIDAETYQQIKAVKSVRGSRLAKGRALSVEEIRALFQACDARPNLASLRDAAIIATLAGCGLRRAEITNLSIENLDLAEQSFKILGKGNKEREAFMPPSTWGRLKLWLDARGASEGPVFCRIRREQKITGERLSSQAVYHILRERQVQAGVKEFAPHDLRRTFASMLLANGEDIITVKDAMGHESVTTTQKYDRRGSERLRQASQKLGI